MLGGKRCFNVSMISGQIQNQRLPLCHEERISCVGNFSMDFLRGKLFHGLHSVAAMQFAKHFGGHNVGWEEMLQCQHDLL